MKELETFARAGGMKTVHREAEKTVTTTKKLKDETAIVGKRISQISGGFERLTGALKVVLAYGVAGTAVYKVVQAFQDAKQAVMEYSQTLKNLEAIIGATEDEITFMGEKLLEVAARTRYSATEVGTAMVLLGQSGLSAAEAIDAIEAVANLATGTLSDMKTAGDLLTTAIRAFGIDSSRSSELADIFANAVNKSKLTIDKLRISFNYLAPVAAKAGVSINETTAAAMVLANAGIRASTIGTGLRQVFARLVAPSEKLREQYAALGIKLEDLNPATNDFADVLERLTEIVPDAQKAFELFGLRGAPAVAALTTAGRDAFEAMLEYTYQVGAASRMAETQMEGLGVMAKNLQDKIQVLFIALGEGGLAGAMEGFYQIARATVDMLIDFARTPLGYLTTAFVGLTTVIGAAGIALSYLNRVFLAFLLTVKYKEIKLLVDAFGLWRTAMMALQGDLAAVIIPGRKLQTLLISLRVAVSRLWAALTAHPIVMVASAIALLVGGIFAYQKGMEKALEATKKHGAELDNEIKKLKQFKDELEKNRTNTIAYMGTIDRLIELYPEWAESITMVGGELENLQMVLDQMIDEATLARLDNIVKLFNTLYRRTQGDPGFQALGAQVAIFTEELDLSAASIKEIKKEIPALGNILEVMLEGVWNLETAEAFDIIRDSLQDAGIEGKKSLNTVTELVLAYLKMKRAVEEMAQTFRYEVGALPDFMREKFRTLDTRQKFPFMMAWRDHLSKMENTVKAVLDLWRVYQTETEEGQRELIERMRARYAMEAGGILEFLEKINKLQGDKHRSESDMFRDSIALMTQYENFLKQLYAGEMERYDKLIAESKDYILQKNKERKERGRPEWGEAEIAARIAEREERLRREKMVKEEQLTIFIKETARERFRLQEDWTRRRNEAIAALDKAHYASLSKNATEAATKEKARHLREMADIAKRREEELRKWGKDEEIKKKIRLKYQDEEFEEAHNHAERMIDIRIDEMNEMLDIQMRENQLLQEHAKALGVDEAKVLSDLQKKKLKLEADHALERLRIIEQEHQVIRDSMELSQDQERELTKDHLDAMIEYWSKYYAWLKARRKDDEKTVRKYSEEWLKQEKAKLDKQNATEQEYYQLFADYYLNNEELKHTAIAGLKGALNQMGADLKSHAQIWAEYIVGVKDQIRGLI
jgi:TP901 family phage tail tape measure protein